MVRKIVRAKFMFSPISYTALAMALRPFKGLEKVIAMLAKAKTLFVSVYHITFIEITSMVKSYIRNVEFYISKIEKSDREKILLAYLGKNQLKM